MDKKYREDLTLEDLFQVNMEKRQVDAISNLGLAHVGDGALPFHSFQCHILVQLL